MDHQEFLDGFCGEWRAADEFPERPSTFEHHHAVRHGRENRAETVFAVETLLTPGDGARIETRRRRVRLGKYGSVARNRLSTLRKNPETTWLFAAAPLAPVRCLPGGLEEKARSDAHRPWRTTLFGFFAINTRSGTN